MSVLAGLFLIAHGLIHIAVWVPEPPSDAPFDSRHSWLIDDCVALSRGMAILACLLFVVAGIGVLAGAEISAVLAIAAAVISLLLVLLTFNRWFAMAIAINVAIIAVAL